MTVLERERKYDELMGTTMPLENVIYMKRFRRDGASVDAFLLEKSPSRIVRENLSFVRARKLTGDKKGEILGMNKRDCLGFDDSFVLFFNDETKGTVDSIYFGMDGYGVYADVPPYSVSCGKSEYKKQEITFKEVLEKLHELRAEEGLVSKRKEQTEEEQKIENLFNVSLDYRELN